MHVASGFMLSRDDRVWNAYCLLQGYRSKTYIAREKPVQVTLKYGEHNYEKIKRKKVVLSMAKCAHCDQQSQNGQLHKAINVEV